MADTSCHGAFHSSAFIFAQPIHQKCCKGPSDQVMGDAGGSQQGRTSIFNGCRWAWYPPCTARCWDRKPWLSADEMILRIAAQHDFSLLSSHVMGGVICKSRRRRLREVYRCRRAA